MRRGARLRSRYAPSSRRSWPRKTGSTSPAAGSWPARPPRPAGASPWRRTFPVPLGADASLHHVARVTLREWQPLRRGRRLDALRRVHRGTDGVRRGGGRHRRRWAIQALGVGVVRVAHAVHRAGSDPRDGGGTVAQPHHLGTQRHRGRHRGRVPLAPPQHGSPATRERRALGPAAHRRILRSRGIPETKARLLGNVVNTALEEMGQPYVWGGTGNGNGGFDCSGLIQYAYGALQHLHSADVRGTVRVPASPSDAIWRAAAGRHPGVLRPRRSAHARRSVCRGWQVHSQRVAGRAPEPAVRG